VQKNVVKKKKVEVARDDVIRSVLAYIKWRAMRERGRYMTVSTSGILRALGMRECKAARMIISRVLKAMGADVRSRMYKLTIETEKVRSLPVEADPSLRAVRLLCAKAHVAA